MSKFTITKANKRIAKWQVLLDAVIAQRKAETNKHKRKHLYFDAKALSQRIKMYNKFIAWGVAKNV